MMKKLLLGAAAVAMLSTAAMASVMIAEIPGATTVGTPYRVGGMSADGAYVGFSRNRWVPSHNNYFDGGSLYEVATGNIIDLDFVSGSVGVRGVATWSGGAPVTVTVEEAGSTDLGGYREGLGGARLRHSGATNTHHTQPGNWNTISLNADGDGWIVGTRYAANNFLGWQVTGGVVNDTAVADAHVYPGNNVLNGVSHTGMAIGNWRSTDPSWDKAFVVDLNDIANRRALDLSQVGNVNRGQGNAVSDNGLFAGGYAFVDDANSLNGFRLEIASDFPAQDGTYTRLLPYGYDPNLGQQSNVFDMADDGMAVGSSFTTRQDAAVWLAGSDQAILLYDWLVDLGVDMSGWDSLNRAVSVSADGLTIAGLGTLAGGGGAAAFVAVVPEPATLSFLALGGLALLRRRR